MSRGPFRISTLRCPEVRLGSFDFDVFVGRIAHNDLRGTARRREENSLESSTYGRASRGEGEQSAKEGSRKRKRVA